MPLIPTIARALARGTESRPKGHVRVRSKRRALVLERLESLTLLATVSWISPTSGAWSVGANWSGGAVPGPLDDAIIDPTDITVTVDGLFSVTGLQCAAGLRVNGYCSLTVTGTANVVGPLVLADACALYANGPTATFTATGPTTIDGANVFAYWGGHVELPNATTYTGAIGDRYVRAEGDGSLIRMDGLGSVTGSQGGQGWTIFHTYMDAVNGASLDLPALVSVTDQVAFRASSPNGWPTPTTISLPALMALDGGGAGQVLQVDGSGRIEAPLLQSLTSTSIYAYNGAQITLPSVISYSGGQTDRSLHAEGTGGLIRLPVLTTLTGATGGQGWTIFTTYLDVVEGARLEFPALTSIQNQVAIRAHTTTPGLTSVAFLPSLTTLAGGGAGQTLSVAGTGLIDAPNLATLNTVSLYAYVGGQLVLPGVVAQSGGQTDRVWYAEGAGSRISLPALTAIQGAIGGQGWGVFTTSLQAVNGGVIAIPNVSSMTLQTGLAVVGAGRIEAPALTSLSAANLSATGGGQLVLPALTTYSGGAYFHCYIQADGAGSLIELPALTELVGSIGSQGWTNFTTYVQASHGGQIRFPILTTVREQVGLQAFSGPSVIDLPALTTLAGGGAGESLQVDADGVLLVPSLVSMTSVSLYATNGGVLTVPATSFDGGANFHQFLRADGPSSRLNLPGLTTLAGTTGSQGWTNFTTYVQAYNGGTIAFGASTTTLSRRVGIETIGGTVIAGTLDVSVGGELGALGTISGGLINRGWLTVGGEPGALAVQGDFTQTATGVIFMQLHRPDTGEYDHLTIGGRANLDGTLAVSIPWGYVPVDGDRYNLVTFASRSRDFATKTGLDLGGGRHLRAVFSPTVMALVAGDIPDPGPQLGSAPSASNDAYDTLEGTPLTIAAPGVLANDTDPDLDPLTATLVAGPAGGPLSFAADGSFTYAPIAGFVGAVTFTYQVSDGTYLSNIATVTITITPRNHAPTLAASASTVAAFEGSSASLTGTYDDIDGDIVSLSASLGAITVGPGGTWTWTHTPIDGPLPAQSVVVTADDGQGGLTTLTFTLTVANLPPVVTALTTNAATIGAKREGQSVTLTASFTDAGLLDTHTAYVAWGDGTTSAGTVAEVPGSGTITASRLFTAGGTYTVTITVVDRDGATTSAATTVYITGSRQVGTWLEVVGTSGADTLSLSPTVGGGVVAQAAFLGTTPRTYPSGLTGITVLLDGGNDTLAVTAPLPCLLTADTGAGDDTFRGWGEAFTTATLFGGDGQDRILNPGADGGLVLALFRPTNSIELIKGNTSYADQSIQGTAANDFLDFSATSLALLDYVDGGDGNDTIIGNAQRNDLRGGAGDDFLDGGAGSDSLDGGLGNDTVLGGLGDDVLIGGAGQTDLLDGGLDDDTFLGWGDAFTTVTLIGGEGHDRILNPGANDGLVLAVFGPANSIELIKGNTNASNQCIQGTAANDLLDFSATSFALLDYVDGGDGNDTIIGNAQRNDLRGGAGDDILDGLAGNNTLTGGPGADVFRFGAEDIDGQDIVTDFVAGLDKADLAAFPNWSFADLMAATVQRGADSVITLPSGKKVRLKGTQRSSLGSGDFLGLA